VTTVDALLLPFDTWREGLLALAAVLDDPDREKIILARLEATASMTKITPMDLFALALTVPSQARFEPAAAYEAHPDAVRFAAMADGRLSGTLGEIFDAMDRRRQLRETKVFSAFAASDVRRLLNDTIVGFAAAELADVSQRLGEADPFSRLAGRLSLWFKRSNDLSRYGVPFPHDGRPVVDFVRRYAIALDTDAGSRLRRMVAIWTGDAAVRRSEEAIREIAFTPSAHRAALDQLDAVLAMEILGKLTDDIDDLDLDTSAALSKVIGRSTMAFDDGRPITSDLQAWLRSQGDGESRFRLVYDPSQAFWSAMHADSADVLEQLLVGTLEQLKRGGHAVFMTGPLPMHGSLFDPDRKLAESLAVGAPEASDLFRLFSNDGDYNEMNGAFPSQSYWIGDFNPDAITFVDAIANAVRRGDYALCDMLIGFWLLFCTLYLRAPLPDLIGLARSINALPMDHRSSTYAVLGALKREAIEDTALRRDVDAILSWLPLVDTAPPDDVDSNMRDQFSPRLWDAIGQEAKDSLIKAEDFFVRVRRLRQLDREKEPLELTMVNWSRVAESFLRRVVVRLGCSGERKALGQLIGMTRQALERGNGSLRVEEQTRLRLILDELDQLDHFNKKGGKHLDGVDLTWNHVVTVYPSIHWTLKGLLELASQDEVNVKSK
jgi:hypothetical protein